MRILTAALLVSATATAATAQTSPGGWAGPYVGLAVSAEGESDGDARVRIDPGRDSIYLTGTTLPGRGYGGSAMEGETTPELYAGWRRPMGGLVVGVEARLQNGGPSTQLDTGPVAGLTTATCIPDPLATQCLASTRDRVAATIEQSRAASLRLTVGAPLGERLLVSAYAGPAVAWGEVSASQTTTYTEGSLCVRFCGVSLIQNLRDVVVTESQTTEDRVAGFTAGVTVEAALTSHVSARADLGYARYEAFRGSTGGTQGADSEVWAQKAGFVGGVGLSFRF